MKKSILSLLVGSALLIAPMAASAMTPMTADSLKDATGQAGVSIAIDGVKLESHVGTTKYTDTDGYATIMEVVDHGLFGADAADAAGATSIVIGEKYKVQYINAIINGTTSANATALTGANYTYVNAMDNADGQTLFETRALNIDAGTCRLLTAGMQANKAAAPTAAADTDLAAYDIMNDTFTHPLLGDINPPTTIAGVVIGLPTVEIHTSADSYSIGIEQSGALNSGFDYIKIEKGESTLAILGGVLEIAPH